MHIFLALGMLLEWILHFCRPQLGEASRIGSFMILIASEIIFFYVLACTFSQAHLTRAWPYICNWNVTLQKTMRTGPRGVVQWTWPYTSVMAPLCIQTHVIIRLKAIISQPSFATLTLGTWISSPHLLYQHFCIYIAMKEKNGNSEKRMAITLTL